MITMLQAYSPHVFQSLEDAKFHLPSYSKMKFGCDSAARMIGHELAKRFYDRHSDVFDNPCVVFASPYNYVKNASTIMCGHMITALNRILINNHQRPVEYSVIHRTVSYTGDYGKMQQKERQRMLGGDSFYINKQFIEDKTLLFVDDIRITGTHERKLVDMLRSANVENDAWFLYYADYEGTASPSIEADINFTAIKSIRDIVAIANGEYHVIIRPIKYLLSMQPAAMAAHLHEFPPTFLQDVYDGAIAENYHTKPTFQENLQLLKTKLASHVPFI
jgi:hypothetical protein